MLILLFLDLLHYFLSATLFPVINTIDSALSSISGIIPAFSWASSVVIFPLQWFAYILGSTEAFAFVMITSFILINIEWSVSLFWWIYYKIPVIGGNK